MSRPSVRLLGRGRYADQRGVVSTPLVALSAVAVAVAGVAFLATGTSSEPQRAAFSSAAPEEKAPPVVLEKRRPARPVVRRSTTYVEVYNNSNVAGLAAVTAERIGAAGWQVVGSDNWYGTIPASTVYYPPRLQAEAALLGRDLGIERVIPAVDPMDMDRLTLILTADFA